MNSNIRYLYFDMLRGTKFRKREQDYFLRLYWRPEKEWEKISNSFYYFLKLVEKGIGVCDRKDSSI